MKSEKCKFGRAIIATVVILAALVFVFAASSASALMIYVPTDYPTIQQAIDAASPGDTVFVYNGTYHEDGGVSITKDRITLQGEDKNSTTIHGKWTTEKVVYVTGNYVAVSNFTVAGSTSDGYGIYVKGDKSIILDNIIKAGWYGIYLSHSDNSTVSRNDASENGCGIFLDGSSDCVISDNIDNSNYDYGIRLEGSSNCKIKNNVVNLHFSYGIYLESSSNCELENNNVSNNHGAMAIGILLSGSNNCKLDSNIVNSNDHYGIYLGDSSNCELENNIANLNSHGIDLESSSNCKLENNIANSNDGCGIWLDDYSSNNIITGNNADANRRGIRLDSSMNNTITNNNITNNKEYGMYLDYSGNNEIYHNNFNGNNKQAYDHRGFNEWDKGPIIGGNYWSDHVCHGNPSNGTEPYTKVDTDAGAVDNYPFEDPDGWVLTMPTVSIRTDKTEYSPGDTMDIMLGLYNPASSPVNTYFVWYLRLPDYGYEKPVMIRSLTLPADFEFPYTVSMPIGDWSAYGFNATWYVALLETTPPYESISDDSANWRYVPAEIEIGEGKGEITAEELANVIRNEIKSVALPI